MACLTQRTDTRRQPLPSDPTTFPLIRCAEGTLQLACQKLCMLWTHGELVLQGEGQQLDVETGGLTGTGYQKSSEDGTCLLDVVAHPGTRVGIRLRQVHFDEALHLLGRQRAL